MAFLRGGVEKLLPTWTALYNQRIDIVSLNQFFYGNWNPMHMKYLRPLAFISRPLAGLIGCVCEKKFKRVDRFCFFIGYPRSGHSIIGAMLDAHPEICIAMESDALLLIEQNYSRNTLLANLMMNAKLMHRVQKNVWSGYSYRVPNAHQGNVKAMPIIGDKKASKTAKRLANNPALIEQLQNSLGCELKTLHVIRNPFDVISTMYTRKHGIDKPFSPDHLKSRVDFFFNKADQIVMLKKHPLLTVHDIYHEQFIESPQSALKSAITYLGLEANDAYYDNCASITYKSTHRSRNKIDWPADLIGIVHEKNASYDFLTHYDFESD